jgi:LysR family nod box-dependent transcriptional activator
MNFDTFDLNLLKALQLLLQEQNVTAAARKFNVTQSAMSGMLRRLRHQFGDDLLIQVGRSMKRTPRGDQLLAPVTDSLQMIRVQIANPPSISPEQATRHFVIESSDYATTTVLADVVVQIAKIAPNITFNIVRPIGSARLRIERGELDMALLPASSATHGHPTRLLIEDNYSLVCWDRHPEVADTVSEAQFFDLPHIGVRIQGNIYSMVETWMRSSFAPRRRVEVYVGSFTDIPDFLIDSRRVAVMHTRLARRLAQRYPLRMAALPFTAPASVHVVQWPAAASGDQTLLWLVDQIVASAAAAI